MPRMRAGSVAGGMNTTGTLPYRGGVNPLNRLSAPVGQRTLSHSVFDLNQQCGGQNWAPGFEPLHHQHNQLVSC